MIQKEKGFVCMIKVAISLILDFLFQSTLEDLI